MSVNLSSKYAKNIKIDGGDYKIFDINQAAKDSGFELKKLPYSLRVLFENAVRYEKDSSKVLRSFGKWLEEKKSEDEMNYMPARVLMQDFTGVPAIVDLASMRGAMQKLGKNPTKINPMIPVDLVIDHSLQVDSYAKNSSFEDNVKKEMERNKERYEFLKWGQKNFSNFRVVPPGTGICHQVNLEYLSQTIYVDKEQKILYPDTLVGTDSHTTMVNALAVLGWGVGGIEAEAAMLGMPLAMILPEVIGVKMTGSLPSGVTATDLVLTVTQALRKKGVVGKFVEFFGSGVENLSLADRATISNMAPEYGATCGFFPIDAETLKYLRFTGRSEQQARIVEEYAKAQNMWRDDSCPEYTDLLEIDMNAIEPSLAGPKRPQDRVALSDMSKGFKESLPTLASGDADIVKKHEIKDKGFSIGHGDVVIAAITSCTNTSNPSVMIAAGLVAKKASELGLRAKKWVKTSLAPGSKVVTEYLNFSGLTEYLNNIGFNLVGYGCTTCIGNSGPLDADIEKTIKDNKIVAASVLSGNRNFEGRVHPSVRANYLASPPLVVLYALAGTVNIDFDKDPIGVSQDGREIFMRDVWPTRAEIQQYVESSVSPKMFLDKYADVFSGDQIWQKINAKQSDTYDWQLDSTYIQNPPYFEDIDKPSKALGDIENARILALFGDSITTDHISPAGAINSQGPAGLFLQEKGVAPAEFNSYGARRGNHEVMMRGTFANVRIKNEICAGVEGGFTINYLNNQQMSIYDAAMAYKKQNVPLVIFAGAEYGTGSSRDWAAKGTNLLGVKAVIAESFERIHRSNLVGMGVLPILLPKGISWKNLGLKGSEAISVIGIDGNMQPYQSLKCLITREGGNNETIDLTLQVYTDNEIEYIKHGSILGTVVKNLSK